MELTQIHKECDGDAYFPQFNNELWKVSNVDRRDGFSFISYEKSNYFPSIAQYPLWVCGTTFDLNPLWPLSVLS
ncbi:dihydrofolate reductase [Candidatus Woesearchaeota archaeon]|nr:dihydrofolate reductase [Candidatus Woesearchaeota archaeon]